MIEKTGLKFRYFDFLESFANYFLELALVAFIFQHRSFDQLEF